MLCVNITIPVYNEQARLPESIERLRRYLHEEGRREFEIVIADNGSTDGTLAAAKALATQERKQGRHPHLYGRGSVNGSGGIPGHDPSSRVRSVRCSGGHAAACAIGDDPLLETGTDIPVLQLVGPDNAGNALF
jgi:glycosyltransferase involved in cell wall biosynthesis